MGKPKRFKKLLSFFLAFLMLMSSLTVGFTAFAANEHPSNTYFKDAVTSIHHPSNDDTKDSADHLDAVAKSFANGAAGKASNYKSSQNADAKQLSTKMQNQNLATYKPGTNGWSNGMWLEDDDNGTMLSAVSNYWKIVFSDCLTENQKAGKDGTAGINSIRSQIRDQLANKMGGDYNTMIDDKPPYYTAALLGSGGKELGTNQWPTDSSTVAIVNLKEAYYLWNAYGDNIDNLSDVLTTKYMYYYRIKNLGGWSKSYAVEYWAADKGVDFILVNADELKAFKNVFVADDGTNYWNDFNNRNFSNISASMQLKLVEELEAKYNLIKTTNKTKEYNWNVTWREDPNDPNNIQNIPNCVEGKYNLTTDQAANEKIFAHFFTSYNDFNADLNAFYLYMVQQYIDSVNKVKDALYNADGSEKNVTDRKELAIVKQLIADALVVYNNIPDSVKNNASVKATLADANARYNTYNIRFISLWNTMVGKTYIETGKVLEPYASDDYVIKSDAEAKIIRRTLDEAESLFVDFLPEGTDYKNIANPPYSITDPEVTVSKIGDANTIYKAALKTYEEYMYRRFLEIARAEFKDYFTNEPQWDSITIPTNFNIFSIIPVRSQVNKVLSAYASIADRYQATSNSNFFVEIARRLNQALEPLTGNESFNKDTSLYQLIYPMKDVQVDKNNNLSQDDVNQLIANLDAFLVGNVFRNELLDGYTADQFIDILLQGFYVDSNGIKHYGQNKDGTTKTEGLLTGKSGNNIANMILGMLGPLVQNALKDVKLDTIDVGIAGLTLVGSAYDLQQGNASAKLGPITAKLKPFGYLLVGNPKDVWDYELIKANPGFLAAARGLLPYSTVWEAVDWSGINWKIDDTQEFFEWIGCLLSLIDRISAALFFDYTYKYHVQAVGGIVDQNVALEDTFKPSHGYQNVILPFLEILGVNTNGIDTATMKTLSESNRWDTIVKTIGDRVLTWAKELVTDKPISKIVEILPNLAYMLLYDKLTWGVDSLTYTLTELGIKWRDLLQQPDTFKIDSDFLTGLLTGLMGEDSKFQLPALDWAKLSYLGDYIYKTSADDMQQKYIDAYAPDVLVFVVYYLATIVTENGDFLCDLVGEVELDPDTGQPVPNPLRDLIGNVVDTASKTDKFGNAREFGSAIFKLIRTYSAADYDWSKFSWTQSLVDFSTITLFTRQAVVDLISYLSEMVNILIPKLLADKETGKEKTLMDLLNQSVFKSSLIDTLFNTIYGLLGSDVVQMILKFVEIRDQQYNITHRSDSIDVSIDTVRATLKAAGFGEVAAKLAGKDAYIGEGYNVFDDIHCGELIDPNKPTGGAYEDDWKITDANRFKKALTAVLTPFNGVIGVLLAGGSGSVSAGTRGMVTVANAITVEGANGYANALKPLLDALGCDTYPAADFNGQPSNSLSLLIDMIFRTVETYCNDPLNEILGAIPGIAAFIDNNGLQIIISQIIAPFNNILGAVCDLAQIDNTDGKGNLDHQGFFRWAISELIPYLLKIESTDEEVTWDNLQDRILSLVNQKLPSIKLEVENESGEKETHEYRLTIPEINWKDLAGSGSMDPTANNIAVEGDDPGTLVKLVRFIWEDVVVKNNGTVITGILTDLLGKETYDAIIEKVDFLGFSGDKILAIVIKVFKGMDSSWYKGEVNPFKENNLTLNQIVTMIAGTAEGQIPLSQIVYPTGYDSENVKNFVTVLTNVAMSLLDNYTDLQLIEMLQSGLYNSSIVASLAKVIYPLFDNATVGSVLSMIDVTKFDTRALSMLFTINGYNDVASIVDLMINDAEGLTSADYPGDPSVTDTTAHANWVYTAQLNADGTPVIVNNNTQYEWANRFWAKDSKGAYIYENGKHVMSYWEKDENGAWVYTDSAQTIHKIRDKKLSDINWDYCVQEKLFHINIEPTENETAEEKAARIAQIRSNLVNAISTVLYPFLTFVDFMFNSGTINIAGVAPLVGADGYGNAIYPLLKLLGVTAKHGLVEPNVYKEHATKNKTSLVADILSPLLEKLDEIIAGDDAVGPVRAILDIIPDLANFANQGGIQKLIYSLLFPIGNFVDNILTVILEEESLIYDVALDIVFNSGLIGGSSENKNILSSILGSIFGNKDDTSIKFATLHNNIFTLAEKVIALLKVNNVSLKAIKDKSGKELALEVIIKKLNINSQELDLTLNIPMFNLEWVAGIGPGRRNDAPMGVNAVKKRTDSFMAIIQYIWKIVQVNKDALAGNNGLLAALLGNAWGTASPFILSVLDENISVNIDNIGTTANKDKVVASANEIVAALIQFTETTDSSNHYADTAEGYDADADISKVTWDKFFEYSNYTESTKYDIEYPKIPAKELASGQPEGTKYAEGDVETVVQVLTTIIQKVLSELLGTTVEGLVIDALYKDSLVAQISKLICSLADNAGVASILSQFGVDLSAKGLVDMLVRYGYVELAAEIQKKIDAKGKLSELQWFDTYQTDANGQVILGPDGNPLVATEGIAKYWYVDSGVKDGNDYNLFMEKVWNHSDYHNTKFEYNADGSLKDPTVLNAGYRFTRALVVALSPFSGLINVLFNAGTGEYFGAIEITGTRGYRNAIKPILDVLGCDTVTKEQFVLDANGKGTEGDADYVAGNVDYVLYNIINPVISRVGDIMDDPINGVLDILTSLMAFVDNGGLQRAIEELLYPITQMFGPIIRLATRTVEGFEDSTDIFSIALSFVDLGKGVTWANLHQQVPTILKNVLTVKVLDKKIDGKYVKILSRQVVDDQDKGDKRTEYYYVTNEKIPKTDSDGNPVIGPDGEPEYEKHEDGSFKFKEKIVAAGDVEDICGIEINGVIYNLNIDDIEINKHLKYLAYCWIDSNKAEGASTFAARADEAAALTRRSDAFVAIYRFIRSAIDANAADLIMPLVKNTLSAETYAAVDTYINNVITPTSKEGDNILITLIRVADALDNALKFDADDDANNKWLPMLQITADKVTTVEYTAKTAKQDVARAIETIYGTVNNVITDILFKDVEGVNNLSDFAVENFLNNTLLSTIAKGVFSLADNETVSKIFNILNVSMNKAYIVQQLNDYGYTELATSIEGYKGKLAKIPWFTEKTDAEGNKYSVPSDNFGSKWYISSKYDRDADYTQLFIDNVWNHSSIKNPAFASLTGNDLKAALDETYRFSRALVVVLSPFSKLIQVLTTNELVDFSEDGSVKIQGSYGYTSAIKPLLDALGVDSVHREKYRNDVQSNPDYAIYNVVYPLIDRINEIMHRPVRELLNTLPTLANFIQVRGIQKSVENLLLPIVSLLDPVVDLIMDDFGGDSSKVKSIYDVLIEILDTTLLDGVFSKNNITWDNIHKNIATIANALIPTIYTTEYNGKVYAATLSKDEDGNDVYTISVKKVNANDEPILDKDGKEQYDEVVLPPESKIDTTENGLFINGVAYSITIPNNDKINAFLADLAGCQGLTEVDSTSGSLRPVGAKTDTADVKYSITDIQPNVLVTLLKFVWDEVVQANFNALIDPLLTNVVDPLLKDTLENGYSKVIRPYIVKEAGWFGKDSLNYDGGEFVDLIIGVVNGLNSSDRHVGSEWTTILNKTPETGLVEYPRIDTNADISSDRYESEDVKALINVITNIAMSVLESFLNFTIIGIQEDNLYNSQFVVTLANAFYPVFDSAAVQSVFGILGVKDITLESLATALRDAGYPRTADLVLAPFDENYEVDGVKVNWVERVVKEEKDGQLVDKLENGKPVTELVNKYWATEEDGYTWKLLPNGDHVMTYWIADGKGGYETYTAEDETADPSHVAGTYKERAKLFADINWTPCVEGKFFNIQTNPADGEEQWRENLVTAVSTILYPLNDLLDFVLNGGELTIGGVASFRGSNGYENAIYPLLQVLGCSADRNGLVTPEQYSQNIKDNGRYHLSRDILAPLFSRLNNILRGTDENTGKIGPVRALLNIVPNLALFVEEGGVQKLVEELIYPIGNLADTIVGVLSKDKSSLFNVVFDSFVTPDAMGFEGTGITDRIIEKILKAIFDPAEKTDADLQWSNAHKHIFDIVAGFVKEDKDDSNKVYLSVDKDGKLEINNITIAIEAQKNENGIETRPAIDVKLPAIKIDDINVLLNNLSRLGAPIPWGTDNSLGPVGTQRRTDAFVILWNYIWGVVEKNPGVRTTLIDDILAPLLGEDTFKLVGDYISNILSRTSEEVLSAFIAVTKALDTSDIDVSETWENYFTGKLAGITSPSPVQYPVKNYGETIADNELYTRDDVGKVVHTISGIAQSALAAATGNTLSDLSVDLLYNTKLVATISQAICAIADNKIAQAFLPLLDVDLSIDGIETKLRNYGYVEIADKVAALKSTTPGVQDDGLSTLDWFVQDKDDKGNLIFEEDGKTPVMVPSELAEKWYVEDADLFITNVWNNSTVKNPNMDPSGSDIDANYRFTRALVVAVSPFSSIINTLFNADKSTIFGEIELTGTRGYRNAVKPLLEALGTNPMSKNDFVAYANGGTLDDGRTVTGNKDYVIYNIVNPILSKINSLIGNPGNELFGTIASLGAFLSDEAFAGKGNLQSAVEYLLAPILKMVDPIVKLASDDDLFTIIFNVLGIYHHDKDGKNETLVTWNNIHQHLFDVVAHVLRYDDKNKDKLYMTTLGKQLYVNNIIINDKKYTLTIPEYDLSKLKDCTVESETAKRASDAFVTVFRYIRSILNANSIQKNSDGSFVGDGDTYRLDDNAFIPALINDLLKNADLYAKLKPYLQNVLGSQEDEILITVIRIFEGINSSALETDLDKIAQEWADKLQISGTSADVNYNGLEVSEVTSAIKTLRDSVHNALAAYAPEIDIENFTSTNLYKDSIPHMLASVIFPLGDNPTLAALLSILHIDVTRQHIIAQLDKYGYKDLSALIQAVPEDEKLADSIPWTVKSTDENGNEITIQNPDIAKLWYVEDETGFNDKVWKDSPFKNDEVLNGNQALDKQYRFTRSLVVVLSPFTELLGVLLQQKDLMIFEDPHTGVDGHDDVVLRGEYGYSNAVKPLLEALGIDAIDGQTYRDMADESKGGNKDYILYNIINPILARADVILQAPVNSLLETLPTLAQYLGKGGLQKSITNLLYPFTKLLSPVIRLVLGEVRSEKDVTPEKFYDLVIALVAEIADIDLLKGQDDLWSKVHEWDKLTALLDGVLDMLNVKTTVAEFNGHYVKVTPVTEKDADGNDVITHYEYKYTEKDADGKDVEKTEEFSVRKVQDILGIEINGVVYPITIPSEGPFDKIANCQILKAETQKAIDDAKAAVEAAGTDTTALEAAKKALEAAEAAASAEVKANTLLALIQYICDVVEENEPELITPLLKNLLGSNYDTFGEYINRVLGKVADTPEDISTALVELLNATDSSDHFAEGWDIFDKIASTDVKYDSFTRDDVTNAIKTLSEIVTGVLENVLNTSITEITTEKIYISQNVNKLAQLIYSNVAGMESTLKLAGIDVSKENVVKLIGETYGYADIAELIKNAPAPPEGQNWAYTVDWIFDWKINNNSENFAHAIVAVLSPFNSLLSALLCADQVDIAQVITITGANGYKNALQPLLKELGFDTTLVDENAPALEDIIKVVLAKLDSIVKDDNLVGRVIDFIPGLANIVANRGVQKFIEELLFPIINLINPILALIVEEEDQSIFDFAIELLAKLNVVDLTAYGWSNVHTQIFTIINSFIKVNYAAVDGRNIALTKNGDKDDANYGKFFYVTTDANGNSVQNYVSDRNVKTMTGFAINGTAYPLNIPEGIDGMDVNIFNALAGCKVGRTSSDEVSSDALVTVLRYIWEVVQANKDDLIKSLVKDLLKDNYEAVSQYLNNFLDKTTADQFVEALIEILTNLGNLNCNVDWSFLYDGYTSVNVDYPLIGKNNAKATAQDIAEVIATLSDTVENVIPMLLKDADGNPYASLSEFVSEKLYTDSIVNALAKLLIPLCENKTVVNILSILGIDYSIDTILKNIVSGFGNETNVLSEYGKAGSFAKVEWNNVTWGIDSKEAFVNAFANLLTPFTPVLDFLLNGKDLVIANGALSIPGDMGYANAIKPFLEAFGCDTTVVDNANASISGILTALLNRVDVILNAPIDEVTALVAPLMNFINKSGIQKVVEELLHPITNIINPVLRLAADRNKDGSLSNANIFEIAFDIVKHLDAVKDIIPAKAEWNTVQNYIFTIVENLINVNYAVVDGRTIALTKNNDSADENYGKFYYVTTDADKNEVKNYVADKSVKQMTGIVINGTAYPLDIPAEVRGVNVFEAFAACGTFEAASNTIQGNGADSLVTVLRYVWAVVEANEKDFITPLLKDVLKADDENGIYGKVAKYLTNLFGSTDDEVIVALVNTVQALETDTAHKADWSKIEAAVTPTKVDYPENGKAEVETFISTLSGIVNALVPGLIKDAQGNGYASLTDVVNDKLYTKSLVETIAKALRGVGVNEDGTEKDINKTLKDVIGIDFTQIPTTVGEINNSTDFARELAKVLAPFDTVVNAILNAGILNVYGIVDIGGQNAYVDAIKPLLTVLGCDTSNIIEGAATLEAILASVFARVDEIAADPVNEALALVPAIANFIDQGGIQIFVEEIISPVTRIAAPIVSLLADKDDSVFDIVLDVVKNIDAVKKYIPADATWATLQDYIFDIVRNIAPSEITINDVKYPLNIPTLDLTELAGCGTGSGFTLTDKADKADTFVTLFGFIWDVVKENEDNLVRPLINNLLGDNESVKNIVDNILGLKKEEIILAIIHIFNGLKSNGHIADWSNIEAVINPTKVKYPNGVTPEDIDTLIDTVSAVLDGVLPMVLKSTGYDSLQALVAGTLYTPDLINTIAGALKGLAENKQVTDILAYVGITLNAADYNKTWNVTDANSFAEALAELVKPFNGVIDALLNGGSIIVAENLLGENSIAIEGENGYVNAIKPLLTVLGCDTSRIVDGKATVEAIVKSLLNRVDEILANPVDEVVALIPQLVNFIDKGGIQTFVEELIYPVTRIIAPIVPLVAGEGQSIFDFAFDIVKDIDAVKNYIPSKATWDTIQNYIFDIIGKIDINIPINGKNYKLNIPALDLAALGGCGTGNGFDYNADKADALIVILRYVWNVVQSNKTEFLLPMLKELLGGNYKNFGQYIETLLGRKDDEVIKAIIDLLKNLDASGHKADWSFLYKDYKTANLKYPNGVTAKDLEEVVQILTVAVNNALQIFLNKSLDDLVPELIYTDSIVNSLANVFKSLKDNKDLAQIFSMLGVDFSKVNYNQKWNVTDKRSFANALATILSPFNNVLAVLLNSGTLDIEGIIEFTGADGYENALKPLLDVLGVSTVSAAQYKADALRNSNNLLLNIINPLLDRVDEILANPIEEVINLLPAIANFMNKGGLQYFVEELIYPLTNLVSPVVKLVTNDSIFDFVFKLLRTLNVLDINISWKNLQNEIIPLVNTFLTNIKINNKSYSITVPNIDWAVLGGCGKLGSSAIAANQGDVLMTILRYVFKVLDANKGMLFDLVGGKNSTVGQIVNNVLKQGADGLAKIIVTILLKMETFDNVQWTFKNIKKVTVEYTEHLGEAEYFEAIGKLDEMISSLLGQFLNISLESVLGDLVYTNSIINTLAKLIYTNIEKVNIGIDLNTVLKVVDLDVSTSGVSAILKDYGAASREIGRHAKWSEVNFDSLNWGFKDGNREGFVNALSAILRPVQPILRVILSGEDLIVLGSIKIKGGNGYNTAIIPLLEALGVNPSNLVSPEQYAKEASTDKVLTNILNPLLDKVEELTHGPIDALTKMLPNIAYFVYNGGIQDIAENLIAPVTNILHEIDPIYSLNLDLSMLGDVDLASLVNGILAGIKINGQPLGIVLPDIDLAILAGLGDLVTYRSARTYFGKQMDCKKINADQAAVFITVLRYIVKTLQQNLDNIKKLLEGLGLSGDIADMIAQVLNLLTNGDVDSVIEGIMNLLFGYDIGGDGDSENADKKSFKLGNLDMLGKVYWVVFAVIVLILIFFLYLLFKKDDDEENPENPEGSNPPEAPSEEPQINKDNNEQGEMI